MLRVKNFILIIIINLFFGCINKEDNKPRDTSNSNNSKDTKISNLIPKDNNKIEWIAQLGDNTKMIDHWSTNFNSDVCYGVAYDSLGNVYCAGYTNGNVGETNGNGRDAVIVKLNSDGSVVWITQLGQLTTDPDGEGLNTGSEVCNGIAVDLQGNIYCGGYTDGQVGEANGGSYDAFVVKLDNNGAIQWVTQLGQSTQDPDGNGSNASSNSCEAISVDDLGNSYCTGYTNGNSGESSGGNSDAFVFKLNTDGELIWITQLGQETKDPDGVGSNSGNEVLRSIKLDTNGNIYCAGDTSGDTGETNGGGLDPLIVKLNNNGEIQWVTQLGQETKDPDGIGSSIATDRCYGVAVDLSGNIYCGGYTVGSIGEANGGGQDAFILKLNTNGELIWVKQFGQHSIINNGSNTGDDLCISLSVDLDGNVYCGGHTSGNMGMNNSGMNDIFIVKLEKNGEVVWFKQFGEGLGTSQSEYIRGLDVDSEGSLYVTGSSQGQLGEANGGLDDIFIMKLK